PIASEDAIGHALISGALYQGLEASMRAYVDILRSGHVSA
ncbi:pyridoxine 5'-phosphate synthase, partial [Xanthomonas axonopodis pv. begoniae]|nr:pyridoxine 5'-phosphate synthase [Xanthomonas axonopodis pv. begoniae]